MTMQEKMLLMHSAFAGIIAVILVTAVSLLASFEHPVPDVLAGGMGLALGWLFGAGAATAIRTNGK